MKFCKKLDDATEILVCREYFNKIPVKDICFKYNISNNTVYKILKRLGLSPKGTPDRELERKICEDFKNNSLRREAILKKYNISKDKLFRILRDFKVPTRDKFRKHFYNQNYFDAIDTTDKAQILGFLYADGCISRSSLMVSLEATDKQYLLDILSKLEASHENLKYTPATTTIGISGKHIKCNPNYFFSLNGVKFTNACKRVGLIPRKSFLNLEFPSEEIVPKHLQKYFILGVLEGDGSIFICNPAINKNGNYEKYKRRQVAFCGSEKMMTKIRDIILEELNCPAKIYKKSNSTHCFQISYSKNDSVTKILHWLYDGSTFHMQRKFNKAQEVLKINISH